MLSIYDHNRDMAAKKYVYPVISRRAGGISIGVNLNTNNACNWACLYCQVPNLTRGGPLPVDLALLEKELFELLTLVQSPAYLEKEVPEPYRSLVDIAFSGNGEPTSSVDFPEALQVVARVLAAQKITPKVRVITNGSQMHRESTKEGFAFLGEIQGEIWLKVDSVTEAGIFKTNQIAWSEEKITAAVRISSALVDTWLQTCFVAIDGALPSDDEQTAYLRFVARMKDNIKGVLLYGMARPSLQPEAHRLARASDEAIFAFAKKIEREGVFVKRSP